MLLSQKRLTYILLASLSFIIGCTLTLLVLHTTTLNQLKPITLPKLPSIKLLVLIISATNNKNRRDAIRETWAQVNDNVKILFITSQHQVLNVEIQLYNDILMVNVPDEYRLLTRKLLESFNSVANINFEYLLKCDDDTFVNIPKVVGELEHVPKNKFYWGYFYGNAHVKKTGKWKENGWILCDKYLPYALGGGYVLSKDLVSYIVNNKDYLRYMIKCD